MELQHQIIGIREYTNGSGKVHKKDAFYENKWGAPTLHDLFADPFRYLEKVPNEERYNLYFTVAESAGKREFVKQKYIPFDIDDIDVERKEDTVRAALSALGLKWENTASVYSGNGVQFFVELTEYFTDKEYFDRNKIFYKACCDKINSALKKAGLPGKADTTVFSLARLMRMPGTLNKKPNKPHRIAEVLQNNFVAVPFSLQEAAGLPEFTKNDTIRKWPPPDTQAVLDGCANLRAMRTDANNISEPLWYANASIVGRLGGNPAEGRRIWHELSSAYAGYSAAEADRKLDQALAASNPRTCSNFATITDTRCDGCEFKAKVKSPIMIVGKDYIATKDTGFHTIVYGEDGRPVKTTPAYGDLFKFFERNHPYVVNAESESIFAFAGDHYKKYYDIHAKAFAQQWFMKCDNKKATEFLAYLKRHNSVYPEWFLEGTAGKMNFLNGVLDVNSMVFTPGHNKDLGFLYVLPYNYDPNAKAPLFEKFMTDITSGDDERKRQLLEFGGYCLSNDDYWEQKAMILVGSGANGKSAFLSTLMAVAEGAFSVVNMRNLADPQYIASLEGKLFNVGEEGSSRAFRETDIFKTLTSGGSIMVKTVYEKPYYITNRTKLIFACNEIPDAEDMQHGFFRRFAIVPFDFVFTKENRDPFIVEKLKAEKAGILNLLLRHYREMKARGHLFESTAGKDALTGYMEAIDIFGEWFTSRLVIEDVKEGFVADTQKVASTYPFTLIRDIYNDYVEWCSDMNTKPDSIKSLRKHLRRFVSHVDSRIQLKWIDGTPVRVIYGVSLRPNNNAKF